MPDPLTLNDWLVGGDKPLKLPVDLVTGCIRWPKLFGQPDGNLATAFTIGCFHKDLVRINNDQTKPIISPHSVELWEGPHDDRYFRVSFMTDSQAPRGYLPNSKDPFRNINVLNVQLREGGRWNSNTFTGKGRFAIVPGELVFDPPGKAQRLPDIEVVHRPLSAFP